MNEDDILFRIFSKQLSLITEHFIHNEILDWNTCLKYLKEGTDLKSED